MAEQTECNFDNSNNADNATNTYYWKLVFWSAVSFLLLIFVSAKLPYLRERAKFFTENALSLSILIAVIAQAIISNKQWRAMSDDLERTDRIITEMEEQRALAEKSSIYAQRAYVVAKIRDVGKRDETLQFRFRIQNGGNTPANNVCVFYKSEMRESPPWGVSPMRLLPEKQIVWDSFLEETERLGVLAPNGSYFVISTPEAFFQSPDEYTRFESGDLVFYCWGAITYDDIFNKKRNTFFCYAQSQIRPEGYPCDHGNEAY